MFFNKCLLKTTFLSPKTFVTPCILSNMSQAVSSSVAVSMMECKSKEIYNRWFNKYNSFCDDLVHKSEYMAILLSDRENDTFKTERKILTNLFFEIYLFNFRSLL